MKIKPIMVAVVTTAAVGGATLLGGSLVHAQTPNGTDTIVDKLAQKFNLDQDEVKAVFEENRAEHHAAMQARVAAKLQAKVDDGTITSAQKTEIEAKLSAIHAQRQALRDSDQTPAARREALKALHEDFKTWADEQGIDLKSVLPIMDKAGHRHGGKGMHLEDVGPEVGDDAVPPIQN